MNKILILGGGEQYVRLFETLGAVTHVNLPANHKAGEETVIRYLDDTDLVVFTGGSDVDPSLYNQRPHITTTPFKSRDLFELAVYQAAAKLAIPMVGICRGAQFLTVMNNGSLYQNVSGHNYNHTVKALHPLSNGKGAAVKPKMTEFRVSSTHHQMMNPFNLPSDEFIVIGASSNTLSQSYIDMDENGKSRHNKPPVEPEIVYYPYTSCIAIQGHPEFDADLLKDFQGFTRMLANRLLCNTLDATKFKPDWKGVESKFDNAVEFGNVNKPN